MAVKAPYPDGVHTVAMTHESRRLERERRTARAMVALYCAYHHGGPKICDECDELLAYADSRLDLCPYGSDKPTCANCPIHCYRPARRERMRDVMRFVGPRMLTRHPYLAIRHMIDGRRAEPPRARRDAIRAADVHESGGFSIRQGCP